MCAVQAKLNFPNTSFLQSCCHEVVTPNYMYMWCNAALTEARCWEYHCNRRRNWRFYYCNVFIMVYLLSKINRDSGVINYTEDGGKFTTRIFTDACLWECLLLLLHTLYQNPD